MSDILYTDNFAYDLSNDILSKGEVYDYDAINQSIENIIMTGLGERLFSPFFGSSIGNLLFEGMSNDLLESETMIDTLISEIGLWENRITFKRSECYFTPEPDNNKLILELTYIVKKNQITNTFKRKIKIT